MAIIFMFGMISGMVTTLLSIPFIYRALYKKVTGHPYEEFDISLKRFGEDYMQFVKNQSKFDASVSK